ncbi:hypothetical protein [Trinickia dinghuensis]|uniref:hypothetical protein n=1 Tax=Trinickia dinghuensis TaxID=2291023 RepID=UPI0011C07722|nr:hypothetical protein [Trinickia dinghuensis]
MSTAAAVCFPPKWREVGVRSLPSLPEAATYHSPQPAAAPVPTSPATAAKSDGANAKAGLASSSQTHLAAAARPSTAAPEIAKASGSNAPKTATISMAVPGPEVKPDISGLDRALLGRTYEQAIKVEGFDIPLPAGRWSMLANTGIRMRQATGMAYFLGRIEHKRLVGAIRLFAVRSNDLPGAGFRAANGCTPGNPNLNYLYVESVKPFDHQACWLINNFFTPPLLQWADRAIKITALDRAAAGDLAAKGVTYPQDLVDVRFTRAETWGVLEVSYLFDPETDGIKSNTALSARESDWHAPNAPKFPAKVAYLAKMRSWGEGFWPKFQQAFASGQSASLLAKPGGGSQP